MLPSFKRLMGLRLGPQALAPLDEARHEQGQRHLINHIDHVGETGKITKLWYEEDRSVLQDGPFGFRERAPRQDARFMHPTWDAFFANRVTNLKTYSRHNLL